MGYPWETRTELLKVFCWECSAPCLFLGDECRVNSQGVFAKVETGLCKPEPS